MNKKRVFPLFTVAAGVVERGTPVSKLELSSGIEIPAIVVGEEGRGRSLGVLPVWLPTDVHTVWKSDKKVTVFAGYLGKTRSGKPKLFVTEENDAVADDEAIVVMRTPIGYRGGNNHTGERVAYRCPACEEKFSLDYPAQEIVPGNCPKCGAEFNYCTNKPTEIYKKFPGNVIAQGVIAQGTAGRMGSGDQLIAVMPSGVVFRTAYYGRLYGAPRAHYYMFRGGMLVATLEERRISDLF